MHHIPQHKRLLSFLSPVLLQTQSSGIHPALELHLYRGRLQLSTKDALYSDLRKYRPLAKSFPFIRRYFPHIQQVLMLGTGLAAGVHLLHQYGLRPRYTLVDVDESILQIARHLLPPHTAAQLICADAYAYLQQQTRRYDLLIVDIFLGRQVPEYVRTPAFFAHCRAALASQGILILNYIRNDPDQFLELQAMIYAAFPHTEMIEFGLNHVFVCYSSAR